MRIATYNVNSIKARLQRLLDWLARESPDAVCLQELKAQDTAFPIEAIHDAGYGAIWKGQRSWNGVAILARGAEPVETRRELPGDPDDEQSRYITHAAGLIDAEQPVVLAGDYNVVPTDFDIYNPKNWRRDALLQPESRACWQRLLDQGWADAIRQLHPEQPIFTFWDYFRKHFERDAGLRIDHLLLNRTLAPPLRAAGVDRCVRGEQGASDHAPTWIDIEQPAAD